MMSACRVFLLLFCVSICCVTVVVDAACFIPEQYRGNFYYQDEGKGFIITINQNDWDGKPCDKFEVVNDTDNDDGFTNHIIVLSERTSSCYYCYNVFYRTANIIQFRQGPCENTKIGPEKCRLKPGDNPISSQALITMYSKKPKKVNCKTTFEGVFHFTYQIQQGGGGICDNSGSSIVACQLPGTPYIGNEFFRINYAKCADVSTSRNKFIRYQCLGAWKGESEYHYAAIVDSVEPDDREKYKCLITRKDQRLLGNQVRWTRSRFSDCRELHTSYQGFERLLLTPIPPKTRFMEPTCNLPRNISGHWYTMGETESSVDINETHIHFTQRFDEFTYRETYFSCQQTYGTRYLMTAVTEGKCEVDFVCFDIMPRHHSIVRYRMGRPSRLTKEDEDDPNYRASKFTYACDWLSFTISRNEANWKYNVLILDTPTPVPCPVAGRYQFEQTADHEYDKIRTRIRGITARPRVMVNCRRNVSEFKSCSTDMSKIEIDAEYCETVDYRGRPIGEYDEADFILSCVGYWMEDMKSYLITHDEEDKISRFRCWVYKRETWTEIQMSRSLRAVCGGEQTAESKSSREGASLHLYLRESERLFDMCPQRYDDGYDPYKKPITIFVLASAPARHSSNLAALFTVISLFLAYLLSY